jgi:hypothetical protein
MATSAQANSNIQESGSVLIFPKVLGTAQYDTLIEITNTGNSMAHAHCYYIDGSRPNSWSVTDFDIWLTKQQPTHWVARTGRAVNIFDEWASDGAGFDPGRIPPVPAGFQGELKCIQSDDSGAPLRANKLIGKATIITNGTGDVSTYNAVALKGNPNTEIGNNDTTLELNNTASNQGEYDACPVTLNLSVVSASSAVDDPVIDQLGTCTPNCPVDTELTLVPCQEDLESVTPGEVLLSVFTYDEFETRLSTTINVDCWFNRRLSDVTVFQTAFLRDTFGVFARFIPGEGEGRVVGVAEEFRSDRNGSTTGPTARAAYNLVGEGTRVCNDTAPNGRAGLACFSDEDCGGEVGGGFCIDGANDQIVIPLFDFN